MYAFCLLAWGLNFIAIKIQGHSVALEQSLLYRLAATALVFACIVTLRPPSGKPKRADAWGLLGFGVLNLSLSYLLLYHATTLVTAALVTLIFSLKTITTPLALRLFLKQALHPAVWLGGAVGIAGVACLVYPLLQTSLGSNAMAGIGLALLGTLLTSLGDACSARNARAQVNPLYANAYGFAVAAVVLGAFCVSKGEPFQFDTAPHYIGALVYLTVVASVLAWLFYLKLVERLGAAASSYMVALFPAVGGLGSVLIGESSVTLNLVLGCSLSCLGAAIALLGPRWFIKTTH
jgi:drug/metabolite transporter (DMT)-like permease